MISYFLKPTIRKAKYTMSILRKSASAAFASLASTNALADEKNLAHVSRCETRPVTSSRSVDAESHKGEVQR